MQKRNIIQPVFPRAFFLTVSQGHVYACLVLPMALKSIKAFVHSALAPLVFSLEPFVIFASQQKAKTTWRVSWLQHQCSTWTQTSVIRSFFHSLLLHLSPRRNPGTQLRSRINVYMKWKRKRCDDPSPNPNGGWKILQMIAKICNGESNPTCEISTSTRPNRHPIYFHSQYLKRSRNIKVL